ncbi:MAG: hypothetical protein EOO28_28740 [Comamonadaceae bacterium]|nr:MAG: hypothetical protein EOO28_28740 [Comamonadaceae bacterium]
MLGNFRLASLVLACGATLGIAGCGGDGDAPATPPAASTTSVPVTVVDGAVRNALVCVDKNSNGLCDTGETSGRTDASGNISLSVPNEDVGKYPILAIVGTDAVDADHGAITVPYTMTAPADKPAVVSPLTTLVQTLIASTGASSTDAEASVKAQTGLTVSLFQDFTKSTTAESKAAGTVARMVVVVTQQQNDAIKTATGGTAIDGTVITKADLDEAVQKKLLELLPSLLTALNDPAVVNATTPEAKEAALAAAATTIVSGSGLNTTSVATVVAVNNQTSSTTTPPPAATTASYTLAGFNFTSPTVWSARAFAATAAMNTPDADGNTKYIERRVRINGAVAVRWNTGTEPQRQSDLHFNGTAWNNCGLNRQDTSTRRVAGQSNAYDYCDKLETGQQTRASFDVAGQTIASVYSQIRNAGYTNISVATGTSTMGAATFPAGSLLYYQTNTPLTNAPAYDRNADNRVRYYAANVAAGTATVNPSAPCAATGTLPTTLATTLETMVAGFPGNACTFGTSPRNEAWGYSSLGIGLIGTAATTGGSGGTDLTGNTALRVAFSGNSVKYYTCGHRLTDGSPRNCNLAGTGTYTISSLGDGRVMTLNNQPQIFAALNYQRVYVERAGRVYHGYTNRPVPSSQARFNLTATNALFASLGVGSVPDISVNAGVSLTQPNYTGLWLLQQNGQSDYETVQVSDTGAATCKYFDGTTLEDDPCTFTFTNLQTGAFTLTLDGGAVTATGTFNFLTGLAAATVTEGGSSVEVSGSRR